MSNIPSAPPPAATPSSAVLPQNAVLATEVSDALRALPPGTRIEVTTLADLVRGQVQANSDYGALTLRGGLPALPANSSLTLILTGTPGEGVSFRLLAINGQSLLGQAGGQNTAFTGLPQTGAALPGAFNGPFGAQSGTAGANGLFGSGPFGSGTMVAGDASALRQPGSLLLAANQGDAVALSLGKVLSATVIAGPLSPAGRGLAPHGFPADATGTPAGAGAGTGPTAPQPGAAPLPGGTTPGTGTGMAPGPAPVIPGTTHGLFAALRHAAHAVVEAAAAESHTSAAPTAQTAADTLLPGSQAQIRLTGVTLPGSTTALTAQPGSGTPLASLDGTVTASPGGGSAVIQTPQGLLLVDVRSPLPVNSHVHLDLLAVTPPSATTSGPAIPAALSGGPAFSALADAQAVLAQEDADAALALSRAIPTGDARMVTTMMAVATAARSVDPKSWMGDRPLKALEKPESRGKALLKDLEESTRETTRPARDGGGDWRMMNLPFSLGGEIDRISLVMRRTGSAAIDEDSSGTGGGHGGGVRFLFALDLSKLGPMQFDGLYKAGTAGQPGSRRLSLLIRTNRTLEPEIRRTILTLFSQSSEAMGLNGSLSFQVSSTFPGPMEALPPSLRAANGAGGFTV